MTSSFISICGDVKLEGEYLCFKDGGLTAPIGKVFEKYLQVFYKNEIEEIKKKKTKIQPNMSTIYLQIQLPNTKYMMKTQNLLSDHQLLIIL